MTQQSDLTNGALCSVPAMLATPFGTITVTVQIPENYNVDGLTLAPKKGTNKAIDSTHGVFYRIGGNLWRFRGISTRYKGKNTNPQQKKP